MLRGRESLEAAGTGNSLRGKIFSVHFKNRKMERMEVEPESQA